MNLSPAYIFIFAILFLSTLVLLVLCHYTEPGVRLHFINISLTFIQSKYLDIGSILSDEPLDYNATHVAIQTPVHNQHTNDTHTTTQTPLQTTPHSTSFQTDRVHTQHSTSHSTSFQTNRVHTQQSEFNQVKSDELKTGVIGSNKQIQEQPNHSMSSLPIGYPFHEPIVLTRTTKPLSNEHIHHTTQRMPYYPMNRVNGHNPSIQLDPTLKICYTCNIQRTQRSTHCSTCQRCIKR